MRNGGNGNLYDLCSEILTICMDFGALGELNGINDTWFRYRGRMNIDANNSLLDGVYYADGSSSNTNIGLIFNLNSDKARLQFNVDVFSGTIKARAYYLSGDTWRWSTWKIL